MRRAEPISIWMPQTLDGETVWVRPPAQPFGDHYASRRELRRKRAQLPLRVMLFGESAAAGYLYAPRLTPAGVLESQLQGCVGAANIEVIDLARTNETLAGLRNSVRAALQINPDVLVVYTGNNWTLLETPELSVYASAPAARQAVGKMLLDGRLARIAEQAWQHIVDAASAVFEEIALIARAVGIPVIVVIPEVNLADWENRQPVHWLPDEGVARWHAHYAVAADALDRGDVAAATDAAMAMLSLDGGECPTSWRLLARARAHSGDLAGAAQVARTEIERTRYTSMAFLAAPQAGPRVQQLQRDLCARLGFTAVDLREVFAEHAGSAWPGSAYFLDYCHLTADGIAIAMAATASAVLEVSGMLEPAPAWPALLANPATSALAVEPEVEALACFGAAIHGAHRQLSTTGAAAMLEAWCRRALAASPGIAATFLDFVEARCAGGPAVLSAALHRNADSPYPLLLQHGWRWEQLDADVILAIREVLPAHADHIDRLLADAAQYPLELCAPPWRWLWQPLERFFFEVMHDPDTTAPAYLRCPWPEVSFALPCDATQDLLLQLTLRLPRLPGIDTRTGQVQVTIGDRPLAQLDLTERWTRTRVPIPAAFLHSGLNRLRLHWPTPPPLAIDPIHHIGERAARGERVDLHPLFGEVFSLQVLSR